MTLKEYIQELGKKLDKQWQEHRKLIEKLRQDLVDLKAKLDRGEIREDDSNLKTLEKQIETLEEMEQKLIKKSVEYTQNCSEKLENNLRPSQSDKIKGEMGGTVSENIYQLDNDMKFTQRTTTINGIKYGFMETTIGMKSSDPEKPQVELKEGFENGERTYYELGSNGGAYEKEVKTLGYDTITTFDLEGLPIEKKKRNPEKDMTYTVTRDDENGTVATTNRPIIDKNGNIIGQSNIRIQENTQAFTAEERSKATSVIERKCKDKDGKEIVLKSVISKDGFNGIIKREDYVNGEKVTDVVMNEADGFVSVNSYKDGKRNSCAIYHGDNIRRMGKRQ